MDSYSESFKVDYFAKLFNTREKKILEAFAKSSFSKHIDKHSRIVSPGEVQGTIYFIVEGYARAYAETEEGEERIILVAGPGDTMLTRIDFSKDIASVAVYQAMSEMRVLCILASDAQNILQQFPSLHARINELMYLSTAQEQKLHVMMQEEAIVSVKWLYDTYPDMVKKVPKHYLASILGMTQSTYSRTIGKLYPKK